jgi:hypothetical protein
MKPKKIGKLYVATELSEELLVSLMTVGRYLGVKFGLLGEE